MSAETLASLFDRLREDGWRADHPFTKDLKDAHELLHHPYALDYEVAEALRLWCKDKQSCQFGRLAANKGQIHFCVVRERDLANGDRGIEKKIAEGKRLWKQRAVFDTKQAPHGFLLLFASPRVTLAAPDDCLRRFSDRLLELAGWGPKRRAHRADNPVSSDFLYLRNPTEDLCYGFQFNVDFFASAGDGRWWHDHRIPGGIGFTANSAGHMRFFKDWYEKPGTDHGDWALKQAMITIAQAHPTKLADGKAPPRGGPGDPRAEGRVTWLRSVDDRGRPMAKDIACPLSPIPNTLQGKDWTRYEELLHTDHAVRAEFFEGREEPVTAPQPYLMDFTYLYDRRQEDFINFMAGRRVSEDEVYRETGRPETWSTRSSEPFDADMRTSADAARVKQLLDACRNWTPYSHFLPPEPAD